MSELFGKNKYIICDNIDDNLCWYRFLATCLDGRLEKKPFTVKDRTASAKKLLCEEHGLQYTKKPSQAAKQLITSFNGITIDEMKESAKKHNINVNIYECFLTDDKKQVKYFDIQEQWHNTEQQDKT